MKRQILFLIILLTNLIYLTAQGSESTNEIDLLIFKGDFITAIDTLENLIKKDSLNPHLHLKLGKSNQGLFKHNKAKQSFNTVLTLDSLNIDAYKSIAASYYSLGQKLKAEENYYKAMLLEPTNIPISMSLCKVLQENQKFTIADQVYSNLINLDDENPIFYKGKAFCNMKTGQDSIAINNYKNALNFNDEDYSVYVHLGHLFIKNEDLDSALFYLDKGLEKNKLHPMINRLKADIKLDQKKYFEAVHHYGNAIAFGDSTYQNYQKMGLSYYFIASSRIFPDKEERIKKYQNCIDAFLKSFKLNQEDQLTCMYLGVAYKEIEKYDEAEKYFEYALVNIFPKYLGDIYYHMADTFYQNKKLSSAVKYAQKAVEYSPEKIIYLYSLATIADKYYKDKKIALRYYQKFLDKSEGLDERFREYSEERILAIKEKLHFQGKL